MATRSIHTKEAAALLRKQLKRVFPGTRFSVRYERYSMGSHIEVRWIDGPPAHAVQEVADAYSGSRFDGCYVDSWLLPDGSAVTATRESIDPPAPGAELVSFHGSPPCCSRELSGEYVSTCERVWPRMPVTHQCALLNNPAFPRCEEHSEGYRLASFLDASVVRV